MIGVAPHMNGKWAAHTKVVKCHRSRIYLCNLFCQERSIEAFLKEVKVGLSISSV